MQRRRLLTATVELVYERGVSVLTAALVAERAGMSRRTFHDIFEDRDGCLFAAFEEAVNQATGAVRQATAVPALSNGGQAKWAERVRAGLTGLLAFLDSDPATARLLIVEALSAGDPVLQARKRVLEQIIVIVEEGRAELTGRREPPALTAEGTVGAVLSVIHARLLDRAAPGVEDSRMGEHDSQPLLGLTNQLMAMIVGPYRGRAAAQKELDKPVATPQHSTPRLPSDPFKDLPIRLTYRTTLVLSSIAVSPGASSKQVALASGITDEGQTSKLLNRLARHGLIQDTGIGPTKGLPRAWSLTQRGEGVLHAIGEG